jgi:uncharacterized delta-60 repeat protein
MVPSAPPAFAAPGDLDPSFGGDGRVTTDFGSRATSQDIAVQPDGRIIVAGKSTARRGDDRDFAAARYLPNGDLDPDFGGDGRVTTDFGSNDHAIAILLQPDGKVILAGTSGAGRREAGQETDYALVRYTSEGRLDRTFGTAGKVTTSFEELSAPLTSSTIPIASCSELSGCSRRRAAVTLTPSCGSSLPCS